MGIFWASLTSSNGTCEREGGKENGLGEHGDGDGGNYAGKVTFRSQVSNRAERTRQGVGNKI